MSVLPVLKLKSWALKLQKNFDFVFLKKNTLQFLFNSRGLGAFGPFFFAQVFLQCIITTVTKIIGIIASLYSSEGFKPFT